MWPRAAVRTAVKGAVIAALALAPGCGGDRYRIVEGPASLTVGGTMWTPEATAKVEAGGRAWFGPQPPPPPPPAPPEAPP